jgi:hypothetical protein
MPYDFDDERCGQLMIYANDSAEYTRPDLAMSNHMVRFVGPLLSLYLSCE